MMTYVFLGSYSYMKASDEEEEEEGILTLLKV